MKLVPPAVSEEKLNSMAHSALVHLNSKSATAFVMCKRSLLSLKKMCSEVKSGKSVEPSKNALDSASTANSEWTVA